MEMREQRRNGDLRVREVALGLYSWSSACKARQQPERKIQRS